MRKKKNNKPFIYTIPFYGLKVYFVNDKKLYNKTCHSIHLDFNEIDEDSGIKGICLFSQDVRVFVIGVFDNNINTLCHELAHLMIDLYEYIGSRINNETTEPFAYQFGEMVEIFNEEMKNMNWQDLQ